MGNNLHDLDFVLTKYLKDAVYGLHILPFFPSSGDRGFAPITYDEVDPAFGNWDDITSLSERYYMRCDYMINHMSRHRVPFTRISLRNTTIPSTRISLSIGINSGTESLPRRISQNCICVKKLLTLRQNSRMELQRNFGPPSVPSRSILTVFILRKRRNSCTPSCRIWRREAFPSSVPMPWHMQPREKAPAAFS